MPSPLPKLQREHHGKPERGIVAQNEERRILDEAPDDLRVAIILLSQTVGKTWSEGSARR